MANMKKWWRCVLVLSAAGALAAGCVKDGIGSGDGSGRNENSSESGGELNRWIYQVMKVNYLWNSEITQSPDYSLGYEEFFRSLLKKPVPVSYSASGKGVLKSGEPHDGSVTDRGATWDPYSYMMASEPLLRSVSGARSFGFEYRLFSFSTGEVLAQVLYVVKNSPAEQAGLRRGDWILKVNGTEMTLSNYTALAAKLIASQSNTQVTVQVVPIVCSAVSGNRIDLTVMEKQATDLSMTAAAVDDNPVYLSTVLDAGNKRIGYLVYNAFSRGRDPVTFEDDYNDRTYDDALKRALGAMKGQIDELVLDLRYNPGGYVLSCQLLASMIAPASLAGTVFNQTKNNAGRMSKDNFLSVSEMSEGNFSGEAGVNLDLDRVYVLVTSHSASASEVLVNGLRGAGVTVHLIGKQTEGKNVGSYLFDKETTAGTTYAGGEFGGVEYYIRPIGFQNFNARGESDFANGFLPGVDEAGDVTYEVDEMSVIAGEEYRLAELGLASEPLLARAISLITGDLSAASMVVRSGGMVVDAPRALSCSSLDRKAVSGCLKTEVPAE